MTETDYIAYFRELARRHKALRHTVSDEHFLVVTDGSRAEIEQALGKRLRLPALLLDSYADDLLTSADNFRTKILGGFIILVKSAKGDAADRQRARDEARTIARSILLKMRQDCLRPGGVLFERKIRLEPDFEGDPAPFVLENADGWGYGFDWLLPTSVAVDENDWTE